MSSSRRRARSPKSDAVLAISTTKKARTTQPDCKLLQLDNLVFSKLLDKLDNTSITRLMRTCRAALQRIEEYMLPRWPQIAKKIFNWTFKQKRLDKYRASIQRRWDVGRQKGDRCSCCGKKTAQVWPSEWSEWLEARNVHLLWPICKKCFRERLELIRTCDIKEQYPDHYWSVYRLPKTWGVNGMPHYRLKAMAEEVVYPDEPERVEAQIAHLRR